MSKKVPCESNLFRIYYICGAQVRNREISAGAHLRGRHRKVTTRQHEKNNFFKEMTYGGDKPLFSFLKKERTIAQQKNLLMPKR